MTVTVRDAGPDDVEGVARVHVQAWRESYKDFLRPEALAGLSVEERAAMWRQAVAEREPRAKFLVAETDGEIVGFVRGGPIRDKGVLGTEAEIYSIYLLDKIKRQGVGRRLMRGVFDHLAAEGIGSVGVWALKDNVGARRFYQALGGEEGPEQSFEVRGQPLVEVAYRYEPIPRL